MKNILKRSSITLLVLAATTLAWAKAPSLAAALDQSEIALGETAELTVTVQGRNTEAPQIPTVKGLAVQQVGQSSQIEVVNGAMSASVNYIYSVAASQIGAFTIQVIKAGKTPGDVQSVPVVLKVVPHNSRASAAANNQIQRALPAPAVNGDGEQLSWSEQSSFGFLRLVTSKKEFYVGEMVPVELKAYFRAGVELRVDGLPRLNSDAFTMNKLGDQPVSSQELINGAGYTVFTWPTVITAVKAGDYQMSVEIPTTVTVRQKAQRPRSRMGNPFGDDFFDDVIGSFFGTATQKQIALNSEPNSVKILSLPTENRPVSFTGAVGKFDFVAETAATQTAAGDPVTLKLKISGTGNFDRVTAPVVEKSDAWKTYKPSAKFEPGDSAGFSGTKNFEQALVPTQPGKLEIPALAFSYFNPEQKQYVTRTAPPMNIEVAPAQAAVALQSKPEPVATTLPAVAATSTSTSAKPVLSGYVASLKQLLSNPWLVAGLLLFSAGLFVAFYFVHRRRTLARDPENVRRAHARAAVAAQLETMQTAAARGSALDFFAAARKALQIQLGLSWSLPPETITQAEINARLNGKADSFRLIFEVADEVTYTGRALSHDELQRWQSLVNIALRKLEAP
jgi:hypothetical protein